MTAGKLHGVGQRNGPTSDRVMPNKRPRNGFGPVKVSHHRAVVYSIVVGIRLRLKAGTAGLQEQSKSLLLHKQVSCGMQREEVSVTFSLLACLVVFEWSWILLSTLASL